MMQSRKIRNSMKKVRLLPPQVISKIAAGEIIERPASVVKELLENSLDAGATDITIHLKDAGKTLIHIQDNGSGIEADDLETIFQRHATSKIRHAEDLFAIHSLGFRGEALYSVGAISDTILKSKTSQQETGFALHLRGGEKVSLKPCTFKDHGTDIEIKELFFNTPARRKFLKTNTTELNQILNIFSNYAILHNQCRLRLTHQGRDLLNLAPTEDINARIADTLNLDKKHMILTEKAFSLDRQPYSVTLVLGDINITRTRRDMQFLFVNGRPVAHKNISFHLNKTYNLILPDGSFPFFAVFLNIPAGEVDVNIHPAKREVKIKQEQRLYPVLRALCEEALMTQSNIKQAGPFTFETPANADKPSALERARARSYGNKTSLDYSRAEAPSEDRPDRADPNTSFAFSLPSYEKEEPSLFTPQADPDLLRAPKDHLHTKLASARFIGSFINKYLLFENDRSLLLIDQHAAAERIAYESLLRQIRKGTVETQMLLSPVTIKLTVQERLIREDAHEELEKIGFSTSMLDAETVAVHSYPQLIKDIERSFRQLLSGETIATSDPDSIARRACRSSVMSGDKMNPEQVRHQREQLLKCLDPFTCPHGRPTVLEITQDFLDKQFLRG